VINGYNFKDKGLPIPGLYYH